MKNTLIKNAEIFYEDRFIRGDIMIYNDRVEKIGAFSTGEFEPSSFEVLSLSGNTVLPSFFDSHTHFYSYALSLNCLNLENCRTADETMSALADYIKTSDSEIIFGRGWSKSISNKDIPTRHVIDEIAGQRSVLLESKDSHSVILNSKALEFCGIDENTAVENGIIERDSQNRLNGILAENAVLLAKPLYNCLYNVDEDTAISCIEKASKRLMELGIGAIFNVEDIYSTGRIAKAREQGRFFQHFFTAIPEKEMDYAGTVPYKNLLRGVKCFLDGALGNLEAAMIEPYHNHENNKGVLVKNYHSLMKTISKASLKGLPAVIHAIGDRANKTALDALKDSRGRKLAYHDRIEHAQLIFPGFSENNYPSDIIFSMQPAHLLTDIKPIERFWGKERAKYAFAFKTLKANGNPIIFGTDTPIEKPDPLYGLYAAINRRDRDNYPQDGFMPEEAMEVEDAIASYTTTPRRIYGIDNAIRLGSRPDFIIYDRNIDFSNLRHEDLDSYKIMRYFR